MYKLQNVRLWRGQNYVLSIPKLEIKPGAKLALIGPSGCGKSTALDLLGLLLRPQEVGEFIFNPSTKPINLKDDLLQATHQTQNTLAKIRQQYLGYVLQTGGLFPFLTVYENLALQAKILNTENSDQVIMMAKRLYLQNLLTAYPKQLSIGERQRVAIGRAMLTRPKIILADEPTSALDPILATKVLELFITEVQASESTLIMVTHNLNMAKKFNLRPIQIKITRANQITLAELVS